MRKGFTFVLIIIILLGGLGIAALLLATRPRQQQKTHSEIDTLVTAIIANDTATTMTVEGFGTVRAKKEVTATAEVSGKIMWMSAKANEGRFFKKGDLLTEIDPRSYELPVKRIKANIEKQKAELLRVEQERENNQRNLELASEHLGLARKEWERQKQLRATQVAADASVESARAKYLLSKTKNQAIENALSILVPQKAAAQAQLNITQAELGEAKLNLSKTRIFAPFDGRTAKKFVEEGQFITVGTPLLEIYDTRTVEVTVQIPLEDMRWLDLSAPQQILKENFDSGDIPAEMLPRAFAHLDTGERNITWKGFVSRVGGVVEKATRTLPVIAEFPEPWASFQPGKVPPLVPGMFVRVEIMGRCFSNIYELPRSAIRPATTIYIAEKGLLRIHPVHILRTMENKAYVDKGIQPGENIIISPLSVVTEGMKIRTDLRQK